MPMDWLAKRFAKFLEEVCKRKPEYKKKVSTMLKAVKIGDYTLATSLALELLEEVNFDEDIPEELRGQAGDLFLNLFLNLLPL